MKITYYTTTHKVKTKRIKEKTLNAFIKKHNITQYMLDDEAGYTHLIIGRQAYARNTGGTAK